MKEEGDGHIVSFGNSCVWDCSYNVSFEAPRMHDMDIRAIPTELLLTLWQMSTDITTMLCYTLIGFHGASWSSSIVSLWHVTSRCEIDDRGHHYIYPQ